MSENASHEDRIPEECQKVFKKVSDHDAHLADMRRKVDDLHRIFCVEDPLSRTPSFVAWRRNVDDWMRRMDNWKDAWGKRFWGVASGVLIILVVGVLSLVFGNGLNGGTP